MEGYLSLGVRMKKTILAIIFAGFSCCIPVTGQIVQHEMDELSDEYGDRLSITDSKPFVILSLKPSTRGSVDTIITLDSEQMTSLVGILRKTRITRRGNDDIGFGTIQSGNSGASVLWSAKEQKLSLEITTGGLNHFFFLNSQSVGRIDQLLRSKIKTKLPPGGKAPKEGVDVPRQDNY